MGKLDRINRQGLLINVAATCQATKALGPGLRSVVWVQGCPFHCKGCISPEWIPERVNRLVSPAVLAKELLAHPDVNGITISGGEPMQQAAALAETARLIRLHRDVSIICFTGYLYEDLLKTPQAPGVISFLSEIDVLIDGPYIAHLNNFKGLRGSVNQRIIFLTDRLSAYNLEDTPRAAEINIQEGHAFLVGVPPKGMNSAFNSALRQLDANKHTMVTYERT